MREIEAGCMAVIVPAERLVGGRTRRIKGNSWGTVVTVIGRYEPLDDDPSDPVWETTPPNPSHRRYVRRESGLLRIDGLPEEEKEREVVV